MIAIFIFAGMTLTYLVTVGLLLWTLFKKSPEDGPSQPLRDVFRWRPSGRLSAAEKEKLERLRDRYHAGNLVP